MSVLTPPGGAFSLVRSEIRVTRRIVVSLLVAAVLLATPGIASEALEKTAEHVGADVAAVVHGVVQPESVSYQQVEGRIRLSA